MGGFDSWGSPSIILNCLLSLIICACTYHIVKNVKTTFTEAFQKIKTVYISDIEVSMQRETPPPSPRKKVMSTNVVPMVYGMICSSQSETQQVSKIAGDIQEFHPNNASAPIYSRAHKIAWHWNTNHEQVNYSIKKKGVLISCNPSIHKYKFVFIGKLHILRIHSQPQNFGTKALFVVVSYPRNLEPVTIPHPFFLKEGSTIWVRAWNINIIMISVRSSNAWSYWCRNKENLTKIFS